MRVANTCTTWVQSSSVSLPRTAHLRRQMLDARAYQRTRAILGFIVSNKKTKRQLILAPTRRSSHPLLIYGFPPPQHGNKFSLSSDLGVKLGPVGQLQVDMHSGMQVYGHTSIQAYQYTSLHVCGYTGTQVFRYTGVHVLRA